MQGRSDRVSVTFTFLLFLNCTMFMWCRPCLRYVQVERCNVLVSFYCNFTFNQILLRFLYSLFMIYLQNWFGSYTVKSIEINYDITSCF
jgi:hypothetical protein